MNETRRLAEFVSRTAFDDLPQPVVAAMKVYVLDSLASGFVGSRMPWVDMVAGLARDSGGDGPCSLFGRSWGASASYAALVNGTAITGFETDHAHSQAACHPGGAAFPAVLALAERGRVDGRTLLLALAMGYEVSCRAGAAATRDVEDVAGFHGPGVNAVFGGAAGAGKTLGLDVQGLVNALGVAGSHSGGLLEFAREGAMTKRLHIGRGSQMGLESALLASAGFTGPSTVLEGDHGFLRVYSPSPRPELLTEGLGERYMLLGLTLKAYACHLSSHPVVDAVCRFRAEHPFEPGQVERVAVTGAGRMLEPRFTSREPSTIMGAQYSLPFSVAVALCRDIRDPRSYCEETLWDPEVRAMAARVQLAEDAERFGRPGGPVAEVTLTVAGSAYALPATDWKGAPTNPYTYQEAAAKFRRYAAGSLAPERIEELVHRVDSLADLPDSADLAGMLRTP